MTRDEARAQIQFLLGRRTDLVSEIEAQLRFQQEQRERDIELPYFLRTETLTLTCTAADERMAPPADFLRVWEDDALKVRTVDDATGKVKWVKLEKDAPDYLRENLQLESPAIPQAYSWDGTSFILFPTPDIVYTFRMIYYAKDAVLSSNIENKWLKFLPELLVGEAGLFFASGTRDTDAQAAFALLASLGRNKKSSTSVDQDMAGARLVMGGPD